MRRREPHILPLLQEPTGTQALDGEDVGTPVTHHQAAFTGSAHRHRHVGHTYARARRMAHGKVYNLKPIQLLHSWKHSPPSRTQKNTIFQIPTRGTRNCITLLWLQGCRVAKQRRRCGRSRMQNCSPNCYLGGGFRVLGFKQERLQPCTRTLLSYQHITQKDGKLILYKTRSCS